MTDRFLPTPNSHNSTIHLTGSTVVGSAINSPRLPSVVYCFIQLGKAAAAADVDKINAARAVPRNLF